MSWWRRRTLRVRLMLIGVVGLCLGFLLGGLLLVVALGWVLQRSVDAQAEQTARDVAVLVNTDALPTPLPVAGSGLVQVVDDRSRVRSSSIDADRLVSMLHEDELARVRAGEKLFLPGDRVGLVGPVRVVAVAAGPTGDPQTVVVVRPISDVLLGVGMLRTILLIVFPLLVAVLAVVAWRAIGATLAPVEALRQGAEEITGRGRSGRLPVPVANDEIQRLAVTLNGMVDRLEAGRTRQREFVGDAAHELRSPLANMRTQLEVAQRLGPEAPWPAVAEDLLIDTTRLARLVDDLLLLARSDEVVGLSRTEPLDLRALLADVASRYLGVTLAAADAPLWSVGESEALRRVVANLLDNAVRHAHSAVTLELATGDDGAAVFTVTDDGPGIPVADRARVFERFTRLDDARARDGGGAGLGLAIVAELVRRHGGAVTLSDGAPAGPGRGPAKGLRVEVRLPVLPVLRGRGDAGLVAGSQELKIA